MVATLDRLGAEETLAQHRAAHRLVHDIVAWVELCPPNPAETPVGQQNIERWREGLVERLDELFEAMKAHIAYEETTDLFEPRHPAFRKHETEITHLLAEHPLLLASLERLRREARPRLIRALVRDTREFLELYERHECAENQILADVYGLRDA